MEDILKRLSRRCDCANYIGGVKCQCCAAANEIESLRATISRLREYVEHVGHTRSCAYIRWLDNDFDGDDEEKPCDCGYDAPMADLGERK